jgi:AcrR family transcriptional regulator
MSIRTIAARLGISPSTVHGWIRDIELTPEQRNTIRQSDAVRRAQAMGNRAMRARAREKRLAAQEHGRHLARQNNPLHLTGCTLYWAEGSKRRNDVEFTNSDPDMMRTFVAFLRRCYEVRPDHLRLTLNLHLNNGLRLSEIEAWWLARLNLSPRCLGSHTVNRYSRASAGRRRTLPYGTARIVVHSTFIVQSIYGAIQEYARMDRPEWIDL